LFPDLCRLALFLVDLREGLRAELSNLYTMPPFRGRESCDADLGEALRLRRLTGFCTGVRRVALGIGIAFLSIERVIARVIDNAASDSAPSGRAACSSTKTDGRPDTVRLIRHRVALPPRLDFLKRTSARSISVPKRASLRPRSA
jgi:hypothetical protein